jgi:hypothetical protein
VDSSKSHTAGLTCFPTRGLFLCCLAALGLLVAGTSFANAQTKGAAVKQIDLLFSHSAPRGEFKPRTGDKPGKLLVLHRVSPTLWFQGHPGRQSGRFSTKSFVREWKGFGFRKDPPNAALTVRDSSDDRHQTVVVELRHPTYESPAKTVRYRVRVLPASGSSARPKLPHRFTEASLFIDDATSIVVGDCVIQPFTQCLDQVLVGADLPDADLAHADLRGAGVNYADLAGADLSWAQLGTTDLGHADLTNANLVHSFPIEAFFWGTKLTGADLTNADLSGAHLGGAILTGADLTGADLSGADLDGAILCDTTMPDGSVRSDDC